MKHFVAFGFVVLTAVALAYPIAGVMRPPTIVRVTADRAINICRSFVTLGAVTWHEEHCRKINQDLQNAADRTKTANRDR